MYEFHQNTLMAFILTKDSMSKQKEEIYFSKTNETK